MTQHQMTPEEAADLRRRAEERLQEKPSKMDQAQTREELSAHLEELTLQRLELEIQNEELRQTCRETEIRLDKWEKVFHALPDLVMIVDPHHRILKVNKAMAEKLGKSPEEMIGQLCYPDVHGTTEPPTFCPHVQLLKDEQDHAVEIYEERLGGDYWVTVSPLRDKEGTIIGSIHTARDITERKRTEEMIRIRLDLLEYSSDHTLEELLQKTLDELGTLTNSPIGFYHFLSEDEKTIYLQMWSTRTMQEFCTAEGKGQHYPVDQAGVWADAIRERGTVIHNDYASLPHRKGLPEGHAAVIRELVVPIMRFGKMVGILGVGNKPSDYTDEDATVVSYLADVSWEITGRKRTEEELKESEKELAIRNRLLEIMLFSPDEQSFTKLLELFLEAFDSQFGTFGFFNSQGDFVVPSLTREIYWEQCRVTEKDLIFAKSSFHGIWEKAIKERKILYDNEGPFRTPEGHIPIQNTIVAPVVYQNQVISTIHLANKLNGYDGKDVRLLERIVGQIAPVLQARIERDQKGDERKKLEETQMFLIESSSIASGQDFFESLARFLAKNLEMDFVCIDKLEGDGLSARTLAVYFDGQFQDNITYALKDTPCGDVVGQTICCFPRDVRLLFPKDEVLQEMSAESYLGTTLWSSEGKPIGLIAVIGRHPLTKTGLAESIMKLVSIRAAGELERRQAEEDIKKALEALNELNLELENRVFERTANLQKEIRIRRQAEERIVRSKDLLQQVFDGITDPLIMVDRMSTILMINKSAAEYYLASPKDLIGKTLCLTSKGREGKPACLNCKIPEAVVQGDYQVFERKGFMDHQRIEQVAIYPLRPEEGKDGAAVIRISDITEARLLEKQFLQNQRLASLGFLISGVAHEINNPNSFITFNIPILRDYLLEIFPILDGYAADHPDFEIGKMPYAEFRTDILRLLENIEHGSRRINTIVSGLKEFAGHKDKKEMVETDLRTVLEKALILSRSKINRMVKRVEVITEEDLPRLITNPGTIEQVIINLLINAAQSACREDSWVKLEAKRGEPPQERVIIEVSDNGCGMDEETQEKIFDPFFTTKEPGEGTGLGLSVSHTQIQALGGRIEVESRKGEGSTFRVILGD